MNSKWFFMLLIVLAATVIFPAEGLTKVVKVYGQEIANNTQATSNQTATTNTNTPSSLQNESRIVSVYIPLTGQLSTAGYIHLMDFTPFKVARGELAIQAPCSYNGNPAVTVIAGDGTNFTTVKLGSAYTHATLDGKTFLQLSLKGTSCLYHAAIPTGATDINLINTLGDVLRFYPGTYEITITALIT